MSRLEIKKGIVKNGELITSCKYDEIKPIIVDGKEFSNVFEIMQDGKLGMLYVDENESGYNNKILGLHEIYHVSKKYAIVSINDNKSGIKYGFVRLPYLSELTRYEYDEVEVLDDDLIKVKRDGLYGVIDAHGNKILKCCFKSVYYDSNEKIISGCQK